MCNEYNSLFIVLFPFLQLITVCCGQNIPPTSTSAVFYSADNVRKPVNTFISGTFSALPLFPIVPFGGDRHSYLIFSVGVNIDANMQVKIKI